MTTTQIQEALLNHYIEVINKVKKEDDWEVIQDILRETHTNQGVCNCAERVFDVDIYCSQWVNENTNSRTGNIWGVFPHHSDDKQEVIQLLQLRIDILQRELERKEVIA